MSVVTTVMMTENNRDRGDEDDDEGADRQDAVSQDADSQEDEEQDAEGLKHDEGVVENFCMVPAQKNAYKAPDHSHVWKLQDNVFDGDLSPFLGDWKVNVEVREQINFFRHLFPFDLIDAQHQQVQKGKKKIWQ